MRSLKAGSTSVILDDLFIGDTTSSTGAGLTGLTNATSGLTCYYHRNTGNASVAVTLASMTLGTFTASGFKEVDATNMPGVYSFCPPNAAIASGAQSVTFFFQGATNMLPTAMTVELLAVDPQDATGGGMSNLNATISSRLASASYTAPPSAASIATTVWEDLLAGGDFGTAGSIGLLLATDIDAAISSRNATTPPTAAAIATAVWQDSTAGDFTATGSIGKSLGGAFTALGTAVFSSAALANTPAAPTAAAIATAVWTDTTGSDFTTTSSPGKILKTQLGGAFTTTSSSVFTTAALANGPGGGSAPTAAEIATAVWSDSLTGGDFDGAGSIGFLLANGVIVGGYASGEDPATLVWNAASAGFTSSGTMGNLILRLGTGQASVSSPVQQSGNFKVTMGCDYFAVDGPGANGLSLTFSDTGGTWPQLPSGGVVTLTIFGKTGTFTMTGTVVVAGGTAQKVRFEPTHLQTAAMSSGPFMVTATLANGHIVELESGSATVGQT